MTKIGQVFCLMFTSTFNNDNNLLLLLFLLPLLLFLLLLLLLDKNDYDNHYYHHHNGDGRWQRWQQRPRPHHRRWRRQPRQHATSTTTTRTSHVQVSHLLLWNQNIETKTSPTKISSKLHPSIQQKICCQEKCQCNSSRLSSHRANSINLWSNFGVGSDSMMSGHGGGLPWSSPPWSPLGVSPRGSRKPSGPQSGNLSRLRAMPLPNHVWERS